jgi:general stress protein 26
MSTTQVRSATRLELPEPVRNVLHSFYTAEVSTVGKDGTPVTWPVSVQFRENKGTFFFTTSIGMPGKALNIRRDDRVSLSYSDPTGSGIANPPRVVVQGRATVSDAVQTSVNDIEDYWVETIMSRQPNSKIFSSNPVIRWYMDIYYMRLLVTVKPTRICWWPDGDYNQNMQSIEVVHHVE